jgi:WhiB family redox-sensing transcriptional regulator
MVQARRRRAPNARHIALDDVPWPGKWAADGLCYAGTIPTDVFFPTRGRDVRPIKEACDGCPVLLECRLYALAYPGLKGVWGGLSERERRRIRRIISHPNFGGDDLGIAG